jgi:hypothetical protein
MTEVLSLHADIASTVWSNIFRKGFAELSIDPKFLSHTIPAIKNGMERIISKDAAAFEKFILGHDEMNWPKDSGLYRRSDDEKKWFFHYFGSSTMTHLLARGAPVNQYDTFFAALEKINEQAFMIAKKMARLYDEHGRLPSGKLFPRMQQGSKLTRGLLYEQTESESGADALVHLDRSCITVHWFASEPGLVVFDPDGAKHSVNELAHDTVAVFIGKKFAGATHGIYGLGTPHGVKDKTRHLRAAGQKRFALVSFVHIPLTPEDVEWLHEQETAMSDLEAKSVI